jgi:hypothetical protein
MRGHGLLLALLLCGMEPLVAIAAAGPGDALKPREPGQAAREATPRPLMTLQGDRLSVRVRNTPWAAVLQELERHTGIPIRVTGPLAGTLTQEFERLPLEQGLRRLFRDANFLFFYAKGAEGGTAAEQLIRVWLLPRERSSREEQQIRRASSGAAATEQQGAHGSVVRAAEATASEEGATPEGEPAAEND